jgi:hypothetical protein
VLFQNIDGIEKKINNPLGIKLSLSM